MMQEGAGEIAVRWIGSIKSSRWGRRFAGGEARRRVARWLRQYRAVFDADANGLAGIRSRAAARWVSGSGDPRVEALCRIEVLALGRDAIGRHFDRKMLPEFDVGSEDREDLDGDLEAAFHLLVHIHIERVLG